MILQLAPMVMIMSLLAGCASHVPAGNDASTAAAGSYGLDLSCSTVWVDKNGAVCGDLFVENRGEQDIKIFDWSFPVSLGDMRAMPPIEGLPERALEPNPHLIIDPAPTFTMFHAGKTGEVRWRAHWPLCTAWLAEARRRPITIEVPFELDARVNGKPVRLHPTLKTTLRFAGE